MDPRGEKIDVLTHGYVQLVDFMGDDKTIVNAARVSFGKNNEEPLSEKDKKLIYYLMHHRHTTPFEHVTLTFKVKVPMDTWRQWVRHRTASINEYSTRYSEAIEDMETTAPNMWRRQSTVARQGSMGYFTEDEGINLSEGERELQEMARKVYKERLETGVAKEQARKDLPLSTYTEAYWTVNLHNLFHFLELRLSDEAQSEIRSYSYALLNLVQKVCPIAVDAFTKLRLDNYKLNMFQAEVLSSVLKGIKVKASDVKSEFQGMRDLSSYIVRDEEYLEIIAFLLDLGILDNDMEGAWQTEK